MDELEDLARGRTKAVNTADMPAWAQVVHEAGGDAGVVDLDRVPAAQRRHPNQQEAETVPSVMNAKPRWLAQNVVTLQCAESA